MYHYNITFGHPLSVVELLFLRLMGLSTCLRALIIWRCSS